MRGPTIPDALNLLGVIELRASHPAEGVALIQRAISIRPAAEYHLNLGRALVLTGRYEEAAAAYRKCVELNPLPFEANCALGDALLDLDEARAAAVVFQRCMAQRSQSMVGITGLGSALLQAGEFDQAMEKCEEAIRIKPDWPAPHCNRGVILRLRDDFENGWPEFEWRWQMPSMQADPQIHGKATLGRRRTERPKDSPPFRGRHRRHAEFSPLHPPRRRARRQGVFSLPPGLLSVLRNTESVERVLGPGEPNPEFDVYCPMMSLPAIFRATEATIPPQSR